MLVVSRNDVLALLPMAECIDVMEEALRTLARGEAILPLRLVMRVPRDAAFALMPAYLERPETLGVKVITVFPGNLGSRFDSHQGAVLLFDVEHGSLLAVMDASAITAIRTAAVSAVATRALALGEARDLAILGGGVQAATHLDAMRVVRPVRRVRVWSRSSERAREFAVRARERHGIDVEAVPTARDAVEGADIICTVTASHEPILEGKWISTGAHINAVGASVPKARELDSEAVRRSRLFVDRRESATNEAGDFLVPRSEGVIGEGHIRAELGDVLLGRAEGRTSNVDITLFKSLGLAVEDVAAAHHIFGAAQARGVGTEVEFGEGLSASVNRATANDSRDGLAI